jgi:hypothetical protein
MDTPTGDKLTERLDETIDWMEHHVHETLRASLESDTWTLGDYLCEQKFTAAGEWIGRVNLLSKDRFHADAMRWAALVALRDGDGNTERRSMKAPVVTLEALEQEFPFEGIDEITDEELDPDIVRQERLGECIRAMENQLACLSLQGDELTSAASAGDVENAVAALNEISETAAAMSRAYRVWMRHLEPIWPQYNHVEPEDVDAAFGENSAFIAYRDAA